jgi:hypothetical protein
LSDQEREVIEKAASVNDQAFPDFVRDALLCYEEQSLGPKPDILRDESCSGLGDASLKDTKK